MYGLINKMGKGKHCKNQFARLKLHWGRPWKKLLRLIKMLPKTDGCSQIQVGFDCSPLQGRYCAEVNGKIHLPKVTSTQSNTCMLGKLDWNIKQRCHLGRQTVAVQCSAAISLQSHIVFADKQTWLTASLCCHDWFSAPPSCQLDISRGRLTSKWPTPTLVCPKCVCLS